MPEVKIKGSSKLEAKVTKGEDVRQGVRLWRNGLSVMCDPEDADKLTAEGWRDYQPDLPQLAKEVVVWTDSLAKAAEKFVQDVQDEKRIDAGASSQLAALLESLKQVNQSYQKLYEAAFLLYPTWGGEE